MRSAKRLLIAAVLCGCAIAIDMVYPAAIELAGIVSLGWVIGNLAKWLAGEVTA